MIGDGGICICSDVFFPCGRNFLYLQRSQNPHAVDLGAGRELLRGFYASNRVVDGWKLVLTLDCAPLFPPPSALRPPCVQ